MKPETNKVMKKILAIDDKKSNLFATKGWINIENIVVESINRLAQMIEKR